MFTTRSMAVRTGWRRFSRRILSVLLVVSLSFPAMPAKDAAAQASTKQNIALRPVRKLKVARNTPITVTVRYLSPTRRGALRVCFGECSNYRVHSKKGRARFEVTPTRKKLVVLASDSLAIIKVRIKKIRPAALPLIQLGDITYAGAFRVDNGYPDIDRRIGYGGGALGYNPVSDSLFIGGHAWYRRLCEISIPASLGSGEYDALPSAELLQPCSDVTDGTLATVKDDASPSGSLVYNGRLITAAFSYYDASCTQTLTHGATAGLSLSASGDFSGFYPFASTVVSNPRGLAGYMTTIPNTWRALFGGPALTGAGGGSIISCASEGPAATVFDPDDVGVKSEIPGTTLLFYPVGSANDLFSWVATTSMHGVAFPEGSRSVLFIGSQGDLTKSCYGPGTHDPSLDGQPGPGGNWCYDLCGTSKGTHAYPYHAKLWAYDANELLRVKSGELGPEEVRPYASWALEEISGIGCGSVVGAAFDPASGRLFIAPRFGEEPIIHVYRITAGSAPVDTAGPLISAVSVSNIWQTRADLSWTTDEAADSLVDYGTTSAYGATARSVTKTKRHSLSLKGLTASQTYHLRITATDASGNITVGEDASFTTSPPDSTAPIIEHVDVTNITASGATITWTTDEGAESSVEYGLTASYGSTAGDTYRVKTHSIPLTGLSAGQTYYFRVISKDGAGNTAESAPQTFVTSSP